MIEITYITRLLVSILLSFVIGSERELQDKSAGLRTIMLIGLGATVFTLIPFLLLPIAKELNFTFDFSRVLSYIIGGCGFLAGMVVISDKRKLKGVTTSACIWAIVGIGILTGLGEFILAIFSTLVIYGILKLKYLRIKIQLIGKKKKEKKHTNYSCKSEK